MPYVAPAGNLAKFSSPLPPNKEPTTDDLENDPNNIEYNGQWGHGAWVSLVDDTTTFGVIGIDSMNTKQISMNTNQKEIVTANCAVITSTTTAVCQLKQEVSDHQQKERIIATDTHANTGIDKTEKECIIYR